MKKIHLLGMLGLTFALVFGAASCKQDAGPSGDSVKDVLADDEDLSGTWKITDGSLYTYVNANGVEEEDELSELADLADYLGVEISAQYSNDQLKALADMCETMNDTAEKIKELKEDYGGLNLDIDADADARLVVNKARDKITFYASISSKVSGSVFGQSISVKEKTEVEVIFEKQ